LPVVFKASATCAATFATAFTAMSGPITAPGSNSWTTFIAPAVSARLAERVMDTVLHQDAIDAGRPREGLACGQSGSSQLAAIGIIGTWRSV
jgi:hypothetical protein